MVWKVTAIGNTGTAIKFGADDLDKVSNLFSAVDVDDVDINADWVFRNGKLKLRNPANTFNYIVVPGAIAADRNITLPLLTGSDEFTFNDATQTLTNKTLGSTNTISSSASLPADVVKEGAANDFGDFDSSFKDNRIRIWNPADTFRYTIIGQAISADRDLQLPLTTGTDTLAAIGLGQTFSGANTFSNYIDIDDIAVPSNPASTVRRLFVNTADNKLSVRTSGGTTISLEEGNIPLYASGTPVNINTTAAEQNMLSQVVTGNTLGANGAIRVTLNGYLLQNSSSSTYQFKIKFGGTTMFDDVTGSLANDADLRPYSLNFIVNNANATNSQILTGTFSIVNTTATAPVAGAGDIAATSGTSQTVTAAIRGTAGVDTTVDQSIVVTVTMSNSNANIQTNVDYSLIEIIRP